MIVQTVVNWLLLNIIELNLNLNMLISAFSQNDYPLLKSGFNRLSVFIGFHKNTLYNASYLLRMPSTKGRSCYAKIWTKT